MRFLLHCLVLGMAFFSSTGAWAFANVSYNWPAPNGYNLDQIITVQDLPDSAFGGFFWSHQFYVGSQSSQNTLYMGLQQQMDGSRNVIFSIFYDQNTVVNPGNVVCSVPTTSCAATQGAGDGSPGAQIIAPFNWQAERAYRLRIWSAAPPGQNNSGWWVFYVLDVASGVDTLIGYIYNQNRPNGLINPTGYSMGWGEVYGGQQGSGNCAYSIQRVRWESPTMRLQSNNSVQTAQIAPWALPANTPFNVFVSADGSKYEMLTCPLGGQPSGTFGANACYYLGETGASCASVCSQARTLPTPQCSAAVPYTRRGVAPSLATLPYLGTPSQGGQQPQNCGALTATFGFPNPEQGSRINPNEGVGCHVYNNQKSWFLTSPPTTDASAAAGIQRVCGCGP